MDKSTKHNLSAIFLAFIGMLTLGAIGNAAVKEPFYWLPFVLNLGVYGYGSYKLFKKGQEE